MISFDNRLPENYPVFSEAEMSEKNLIVSVGDYIVDRDGHLGEATTSNAGPYPNEFLRSINEGCFRAKYIGNRDDSMWFANQCRKATAAEVEQVQEWAHGDRLLVDANQQVRMF